MQTAIFKFPSVLKIYSGLNLLTVLINFINPKLTFFLFRLITLTFFFIFFKKKLSDPSNTITKISNNLEPNL